MGKAAKARKADFRKKQKQIRKAAERAKYHAWAMAGTNSKRGKSRAKKASKIRIRTVRHVVLRCGNVGCSKCFPDLAPPKMNDMTDPRVRAPKRAPIRRVAETDGAVQVTVP
jgi:hypothetical protein